MWNYPKSAKHQALIDELKAKHDRELARVRVAEKTQMHAADAQQALDEIKAKPGGKSQAEERSDRRYRKPTLNYFFRFAPPTLQDWQRGGPNALL